jgi:hypothetical protein
MLWFCLVCGFLANCKINLSTHVRNLDICPGTKWRRRYWRSGMPSDEGMMTAWTNTFLWSNTPIPWTNTTCIFILSLKIPP